MMSEQSKRNIDHAFRKAVRATLVRNAADTCEIEAAKDAAVDARGGERLIQITISSFIFRLMVIFKLVEGPAIRSYYASTGAVRELNDLFAEFANLCCGAISSDLTGNFSHLAMSIPNTMSGACIGFLSELHPQLLSNYRITINGAVRLQAILCLCGSSVPVEVTLHETEDSTNRGELELL